MRGLHLVHMEEDVRIRKAHFRDRPVHTNQFCPDLLDVVFEGLLLQLLLINQEVIDRELFGMRGEHIRVALL